MRKVFIVFLLGRAYSLDFKASKRYLLPPGANGNLRPPSRSSAIRPQTALENRFSVRQASAGV